MWDLQNLFVKHAREIDRSLRRRGHSPETAADLMQDAFVRLMTAAPKGTDHNPRAYLYQVARNLSVDLQRRERSVEHVNLPEEEFQQIADLSPSPETIVYDRQRVMVVERALQDLPERTRRAFEMHRMGGKTLNEVAAELGLSTSRTWTLVRHAYLHLRACLKDEAA
ncbi:RNA polymerase sigma factor [Nitratireductor sp. GCM10026969]|uniref:RNA polymerase sigma factor n=1 Tax=Nitratireductor sp. GCM10026969 TaxID=3252645 RepID=UPI0036224A08